MVEMSSAFSMMLVRAHQGAAGERREEISQLPKKEAVCWVSIHFQLSKSVGVCVGAYAFHTSKVSGSDFWISSINFKTDHSLAGRSSLRRANVAGAAARGAGRGAAGVTCNKYPRIKGLPRSKQDQEAKQMSLRKINQTATRQQRAERRCVRVCVLTCSSSPVVVARVR